MNTANIEVRYTCTCGHVDHATVYLCPHFLNIEFQREGLCGRNDVVVGGTDAKQCHSHLCSFASGFLVPVLR